jgi:membrane-bound lytic murein transglycosylase D
MEVALIRARQRFSRVRARLLFPALATAAGLSTLLVGLERTSYLNGSSGTSISSPALASDVMAGSSVPAVAVTLDSVVDSRATLDVDRQHARIDRWVQRLTTSQKGDFQQSLGRMDRYSEMITAKLDERQMPRELVYLAMIESNFNPTARSRVSAVGLWQFMAGTAKQFGLSVGRRVDERKDPVKATDAALTYLSQLHDRFGSWYLAAAAYNSGPGTVSKALRTVTGKTQGTDDDFFRILHALPRETQDYVPKLIASARVGSDPAQYGL